MIKQAEIITFLKLMIQT